MKDARDDPLVLRRPRRTWNERRRASDLLGRFRGFDLRQESAELANYIDAFEICR
jgi:hypothetical protein